jgi:hypothetical protein
LNCRNGATARAVPGGSDGLAQNKDLIHRLQMRATLTRAQFILVAQPKERFVGLTNTQLTRRQHQEMPIGDLRGGAAFCGARRKFARSLSLFINQVMQHDDAGRIEPRFLEGGRSLELVHDRAPIQTARKAG